MGLSVEKLDWNRFGQLVLNLSNMIGSSYKVDAIVGIGKSGLIPAAILAKRLGINEFYTIVVSFYDEGKPPKRSFKEPKVSYANIGNLRDKRVLVVDDFAHSGLTLRKVVEKLKGMGAKEIRTAVVALRGDAKIKPDYCSMTFQRCVVFPWDVKEV